MSKSNGHNKRKQTTQQLLFKHVTDYEFNSWQKNNILSCFFLKIESLKAYSICS